MKPLFLHITLALAAAMPLAASAQDSNLSKKFSACMDKSGGVTIEMMDCTDAELKRQDARLNKAYKTLMASDQTPERKKQLQATQRVWIKFRDLNCDFYHDPDGGTSAAVNASDCTMRMTAERAKELENFIE
ncbi:MAG: lysozyme inhibitor LprI family protein [Giesbergeria sp.]|uniref:lysozyme inhibitor LprI family protein n=1 Tax=Giesbergeria sp. TaxID=2818473 RepID=UPI0026391692|nr:lysozyme inhibitor LprI family protein [Giesbergeria sp.]MDD2609274.1 lysozyme inhibitor LprI family protein [Giesbergeria sp.]